MGNKKMISSIIWLVLVHTGTINEDITVMIINAIAAKVKLAIDPAT